MNQDPELGEPIELLTRQEHETGADFLDLVRKKIRRRTVTSQVASFSWYLPRSVLLEMAGLLSHVGRRIRSRRTRHPSRRPAGNKARASAPRVRMRRPNRWHGHFRSPADHPSRES